MAKKRRISRIFAAQFALLLLTPAFASLFAANRQILLRYPDIGDGSIRALATDRSGNLFTVSSIVDESGRFLMRVNKLDPSGNALASFDFGETGSPQPTAATVDLQGNLIVVGTTIPTGSFVAPIVPMSAFVVKIDSQLQGILFSRLIDQSGANAVALDAGGNIYVAGSTNSSNFPITKGAYHTQAPGAFIVEISPDGADTLFSTQFGGSQVGCTGGSACIGAVAATVANAVAIDSTAAIVFAGATSALDLPVTPGVIGATGGSAFVAKLAPGGGQLAWSTFVNPKYGVEYLPLRIDALAFDPAGNVLIGGGAPNIQTTAGTVEPAEPQGTQFTGFLAKLNASATQLIWSTYMGGNQDGKGVNARVSAIAVNATGQIAFTGYSDPTLLPAFPNVTLFGNTYAGWLAADGSTLQALYVGPNNSTGQALALTPSGNMVTAGTAGSVWIETPGAGGSIFGTGSAASGPVSGLVAPYELISLYGEGLGPQTPVGGQVSNGAFTSSLAGYSVTFDGIPAPLLYLGSAQINAIVPHELAGQDFTHLQIVTPAGIIDGPTLALRLAQPYVFQNSATGLAAALNQDGTLNSPQNPARPGSIVTIYATGGNPIDWGDGDIVPPDSARGYSSPVSVLAGFGYPATSLEVDYAGDAPGLVAGVMQINFRLPATLSPAVPFSFQLEVGTVLGVGGTIAVAP